MIQQAPAQAAPATRPEYRTANRPASHGCRFCDAPLTQSVVDLGTSPLCENFLTADQLNEVEPFYPLHAYVCEECYLVQVEEYVSGREIFEGDYAYFSSFSTSWLEHAARYVDMITDRLGLGENSLVVELASNDGYLLKNFVKKGVPCLGIEPASNVAKVAVEEHSVPVRNEYFTTEFAESLVAEGYRPNLMIANNVMAHVPDLNDFIEGIHRLLADDGVLTVEFPHLLRQLEGNQYDGIYQEHYCYFSLIALDKVFAAHGMTIFDLEEITTHGGSLRIYVRQTADESKPVTSTVREMLELEVASGLTNMETYAAFAERVAETKRQLLEFCIKAKREGKQIVGYGAPGKGNTLLNYCGIREDFLDYTVDRNPYKHGKFLPGSHIPVFPTEKIAETKPDYVLILPWNLRDEIAKQLEYVREWGCQLVVPIPYVEVF